jgi:hypothetical protein
MKTEGSRAEVMHGTAKRTSGGLTKGDLKYNKWGSIVSRKKSSLARSQKHLAKAGWTAKKGKFGAVCIGKKCKTAKKGRKGRTGRRGIKKGGSLMNQLFGSASGGNATNATAANGNNTTDAIGANGNVNSSAGNPETENPAAKAPGTGENGATNTPTTNNANLAGGNAQSGGRKKRGKTAKKGRKGKGRK